MSHNHPKHAAAVLMWFSWFSPNYFVISTPLLQSALQNFFPGGPGSVGLSTTLGLVILALGSGRNSGTSAWTGIGTGVGTRHGHGTRQGHDHELVLRHGLGGRLGLGHKHRIGLVYGHGL